MNMSHIIQTLQLLLPRKICYRFFFQIIISNLQGSNLHQGRYLCAYQHMVCQQSQPSTSQPRQQCLNNQYLHHPQVCHSPRPPVRTLPLLYVPCQTLRIYECKVVKCVPRLQLMLPDPSFHKQSTEETIITCVYIYCQVLKPLIDCFQNYIVLKLSSFTCNKNFI